MTGSRWHTSTRRLDIRRYPCVLDSYPPRTAALLTAGLSGGKPVAKPGIGRNADRTTGAHDSVGGSGARPTTAALDAPDPRVTPGRGSPAKSRTGYSSSGKKSLTYLVPPMCSCWRSALAAKPRRHRCARPLGRYSRTGPHLWPPLRQAINAAPGIGLATRCTPWLRPTATIVGPHPTWQRCRARRDAIPKSGLSLSGPRLVREATHLRRAVRAFAKNNLLVAAWNLPPLNVREIRAPDIPPPLARASEPTLIDLLGLSHAEPTQCPTISHRAPMRHGASQDPLICGDVIRGRTSHHPSIPTRAMVHLGTADASDQRRRDRAAALAARRQ